MVLTIWPLAWTLKGLLSNRGIYHRASVDFPQECKRELVWTEGKRKKKRVFHVQRLPSLLPNLSVITAEIPRRINKGEQLAPWLKPFHLSRP